jgi:hypothetical protein
MAALANLFDIRPTPPELSGGHVDGALSLIVGEVAWLVALVVLDVEMHVRTADHSNDDGGLHGRTSAGCSRQIQTCEPGTTTAMPFGPHACPHVVT